MPDIGFLEDAVVACVGLGAWALILLLTVVGPAKSLVHRRSPQRSPTDAEISARVQRLALDGALPPGWSVRDAKRLLRVHARR